MKQRSTRQVATTYDVVAASADHPTAEQILERVRQKMPRVSLGTVYRNLEKLREQGRVVVVRFAGGVAHYDAMVGEHDHFVCESCGAVRDLEPARARGSNATALERRGYVVRWQTTSLYGTCGECAEVGRQPPVIVN
jgi:Fe2+ or Zn2+ uptake regulation protein